MDLDEFRSFILDSGLDVWTWINMAISMASADYENELKIRRDGITQRLYASSSVSKCRNCDYQLVEGAECKENGNHLKTGDVGYDYSATEILKSQNLANGIEEGDDDDDDEEAEDEQRKVLDIKILLDNQNQAETDLIGLLQRLVDMEITFKVLKETDIGRYVTRLRKHSSNGVRRLVKILVRKWKEIVDEWVSENTAEEIAHPDGDKDSSNEYLQKNNLKNGETAEMPSHGDAPNAHAPYSSTPSKGKVKIKRIEPDDSKRLHGNSQESQNAKKQRTSRVI